MREKSWRESCGTTTAGGGSPRDSARVIISPPAQRRAGRRTAGKESRPALSLTGKAAPRELFLQMEDEIWGLQEWAWYPPKEAEVDSGRWPGGVEAGHSEAWASEPADPARHWLGETEDASEELLPTVQEPGEEAGRPRLHGTSGEAPGELAFQHGEHEGSLGREGDDGSRTQHQVGLHRDEDRDEETVEAERPQPRGVSSEAPGEHALQGNEREGWPGSAALGRPVTESGHSGVQEEEAAIRQWRCIRGEAEARPASKLQGEDVRVHMPAGSDRRGCPGRAERVSGGRGTECQEGRGQRRNR